MASGRGDGERLSDPSQSRNRGLVVVLIVQLVLATAFIVLVATDSIPGVGPGSHSAPTTTSR